MDAQHMEVLIKMEKILVIQTAFIGDAILTLPMVEKLKEKFPSNEIDVLCIPSTQEVFDACPFVSEVLVMDKKKDHKSFFKLYKFISEIKKRNYSKIYSPHRSFRTSFIVMQSGVRETFGFSSASLFHVYRNVIEYGPHIHEVQRNLDLIGYEYSSGNWQIIPKVVAGKSSIQKVAYFLASKKITKEKLIAIAPGSIWETKKYPEQKFKEIVKHFVEKSYKILIIGSESDKELCESLSEHYTSVFSTAGLFSVIESIELLKNVKLLLTNDSAPTHFGMCADIPVLTIFCSTIPEFGFYPYNKKSLYISFNDLNCKPCGIHGYDKCPISTFDCGNKLESKIIITKMEELIGD